MTLWICSPQKNFLATPLIDDDGICQSQDEAQYQHRESNETRRQMEEDADRELLSMRIRHEQAMREQQVVTYSYYIVCLTN